MIKDPNTWKAWSSASTKLSMEEGVREDENADEEGEAGGCTDAEGEGSPREDEGEGCKESSPNEVRVKSCFPFVMQGW